MFSNLTMPSNLNPGIAQVLYIAPRAWFVSIKKPVPPFVQEGQELLITETHAFKPGYGFLVFASAPQKNKLDAKTVGDLGTNWFELTPELFIPGSYTAAHETVRSLLNQPLVALVKDCNCPDEWFIQLGREDIGCWITADFSTGTTKDGSKGYTAMLHYPSDGVYFYKGTVTTYSTLATRGLYINGEQLIINNDFLTINNLL